MREQLSLASAFLIHTYDIARIDWLIAGFVVWCRATDGLVEYLIDYVALLNIHSQTVQDHLNAGGPAPFLDSLEDLRQRWYELRPLIRRADWCYNFKDSVPSTTITRQVSSISVRSVVRVSR
jgi:hypothetical protein